MGQGDHKPAVGVAVGLSKPAGTSAALTAFCAAKVEGPGGHIWIDGNGKITAANGTLAYPRPNAFSLVQIADCPGSTAVCRASCYVHGLEKHAPETHALYVHNSRRIREILADRVLALDWADVVGRWIAENCRGGFRWHVSGDVFSATYADWISAVAWRSSRVPHWIYTRSLDYVPNLLDVSTLWCGNLALNLSCDAENYARARAMAVVTGARLCYLTHDGAVPEDLPANSVIFPDYGLRGGVAAGAAWFEGLQSWQKRMVCPVDYHGKSEQRRCGPCDRCMT